MGLRCRQEGVILNFTTNGTIFLEMSDNEIYEVLKNITMISISFDYFKWGNSTENYAKLIHRTPIQVNMDPTVSLYWNIMVAEVSQPDVRIVMIIFTLPSQRKSLCDL